MFAKKYSIQLKIPNNTFLNIIPKNYLIQMNYVRRSSKYNDLAGILANF